MCRLVLLSVLPIQAILENLNFLSVQAVQAVLVNLDFPSVQAVLENHRVPESGDLFW